MRVHRQLLFVIAMLAALGVIAGCAEERSIGMPYLLCARMLRQ